MLVTVAFLVASWGIDAWWLGIFEYTSSHGFAQLLKGPQIFLSHSFIFSVLYTTIQVHSSVFSIYHKSSHGYFKTKSILEIENADSWS